MQRSETPEALRDSDSTPTALRLADALYSNDPQGLLSQAATELRRLHEANMDCIAWFDALKSDYDAQQALLRQALEALVQIHPANMTPMAEEAWNKAIVMLGAALAEQPAEPQEPVIYDKTAINTFAQDLYDKKMREGKHGHYETMFHVIHQCITQACTAPQPKAGQSAKHGEPVAIVTALSVHADGVVRASLNCELPLMMELYAAPPTPEACKPAKQPLTDGEIIDAALSAGFERNSLGWSFTYGKLDYHLLKLARAIEAAHGITGETK